MKKVKFIIKIFCFSALIVLPFITSAQTDIETAMFKNDSLREVVMSEDQKADFQDKALRKTKALSNYISTVGDKSKEDAQRNNAIDLAVKLFMNENNIVEVSSLNSTVNKRFKVREYLIKLKMLPYSKVTIEWFDVFFSSNFKKRPDGKYEAVATIYQRFSATTNEGGTYSDVTQKNIQIIIEQVEKAYIDKVEKFWEMSLGDIKVSETKKE